MSEISVAINENGKLYYTEQFVKELSQESIEKDKEIDRLNNIINELEKYLNQEIIEWQYASDLWTKAQVQEDRIVLNKLKELKEGNNVSSIEN